MKVEFYIEVEDFSSFQEGKPVTVFFLKGLDRMRIKAQVDEVEIFKKTGRVGYFFVKRVLKK